MNSRRAFLVHEFLYQYALCGIKPAFFLHRSIDRTFHGRFPNGQRVLLPPDIDKKFSHLGKPTCFTRRRRWRRRSRSSRRQATRPLDHAHFAPIPRAHSHRHLQIRDEADGTQGGSVEILRSIYICVYIKIYIIVR